MSTMKIVVMIVLLAVIGAGAYWAGSRADKDDHSTQTTQPTTTDNQTDTTPAETDGAVAGTITIRNNMFTPPQIEVPKGGTVEWVNNDDKPHTVIADNGDGPASQEIQPGGTYRYKFEKSGSVQYHCGIHSEMRGTIVVK